jgi:hypothetical protein
MRKLSKLQQRGPYQLELPNAAFGVSGVGRTRNGLQNLSPEEFGVLFVHPDELHQGTSGRVQRLTPACRSGQQQYAAVP